MTLPKMPLPDSMTQVPHWLVIAAGGAVVVLGVLGMYVRSSHRTRRALMAAVPAVEGRRGEAVRQTVATAGPLAVLGACGMMLSLYGLYGFATSNMELAWPFAIPIMAIFDLAEVTCFVSLYRSAAVETAWTRPMRRTRHMAWMLVAASSAMNAAHAPGNWIATLAFAAVPPISAKLIEFELDKQLAANAPTDEADSRVGLVRLVQLSYVHAWAALFARVGLDPASKDGVVHQDARIRRAAGQIHRLGRALEALDKLENDKKPRRPWQVKRGKKLVHRVQTKAEMAIDLAGIAGDTPAQLMLARHLTARGRVVDLARMDVSKPMEIVTLLEELAIVPSVKAIEAGARAAQADQERQRAEEARDAAKAAQTAAEAQAAEVQRQAAAELTAAQQTRADAESAAAVSKQQADTAAQAAAQAVAERIAAQEARDKLNSQVERLTVRAQDLTASTHASDSQRQAIADDLAALRTQVEEANRLVRQQNQEAEEAQRTAQQALTARRAAAADVQTAQDKLTQLAREAEQLRAESQQYAGQRQKAESALQHLVAEREEAEKATQQAREQTVQAREETQKVEAIRNAASVALHHARDEIMEALTSPDAYEAPRWTSEPKRRGWELYLRRVRTDRTEPTDAELAGADRDPATARKWLGEFRQELARMTAAELPAQQGAQDSTEHRIPAGV